MFLVPLLLMVLPPIYILKPTGENFTSIDNIIQKKENYLIGYLYNEKNYNYLKWKTIISQDKYQVWALGSSRVLQFRSQMFDKSFYNAGYTISSIGQFVPFINSVPKEKRPDYLIINLDPWMFNASWDKLNTSYDNSNWSKSFQKNANLTTIVSVWKDLFTLKYSFQVAEDKDVKKIGLNANFNNTGFRNDGSMRYGGQLRKLLSKDKTANDYNFKGTLHRIASGNNLFKFGKTINPKALKKLDELLQYCAEQNIKIIAFIPPFGNEVNKSLLQSNHYQYMDLLYSSCVPIFKKNYAECYDFRYLKSINSDDNELIDGFHGSEVTYLKILIKMLKSNSVLNNTSNLDKLKTDLKKSKNNYEVYP